MVNHFTPIADAMRIGNRKPKLKHFHTITYGEGRAVKIHTRTVLRMTDADVDYLANSQRQRLRDIQLHWQTEKGELQNLLFCNLPIGHSFNSKEYPKLEVSTSTQVLSDNTKVLMITAYGNHQEIRCLQQELSRFATAYVLEYVSSSNAYIAQEQPSAYKSPYRPSLHTSA